MSDQDEQDPLATAHLDTLAVRSGIHRTQEGEHSEPIFATSSYVFDDAEHAAARFAGESAGNVYSRYTIPVFVASKSGSQRWRVRRLQWEQRLACQQFSVYAWHF